MKATDGRLGANPRRGGTEVPNKELQQLLFSFGPDVEVLSPSSLREDIKAKIAELSTKYFAVQKDCTDA